jgi:hypothetical protein
VTDDKNVAPDDVLAVINYINANGSGKIPDGAMNEKPYCDVNGDDNVVADDVIAVINYINAGLAGEGESGSIRQPLVNPTPTAIDELITLLAMEQTAQPTRKRR